MSALKKTCNWSHIFDESTFRHKSVNKVYFKNKRNSVTKLISKAFTNLINIPSFKRKRHSYENPFLIIYFFPTFFPNLFLFVVQDVYLEVK